MIIYGLFNMKVHSKIYGMIKMLNIQKIPNLFLFVGRDHQWIYFTMLSLHQVVQTLGGPIKLQGALIIMKDYVSALITIHEPKIMAEALQHEGCNDVM
jgi:hypothetical protein